MSKRSRTSYVIALLSMGIVLSIWLIAAFSSFQRPIRAVGLSTVTLADATVTSQATATKVPHVLPASPTTTATSVNSGKQCGTINTLPPDGMLKASDVKDAKQAEDCFWRAYQHCQLASLVFNLAVGVDGGRGNTFTIEPQQSSCLISDQVQSIMLRSATYICTGLQNTSSSLNVVNCGSEGTIIIPNHALLVCSFADGTPVC